MLMQEVLKNLHVTHSSMYNILTFRILVCCVRTIKSNSNKYLSTMKNNMGHFSLGAWPSPAQPSSGGQGFRRSWVQGSGDQGVREWVRVSRDHKGSGCIRVSGVTTTRWERESCLLRRAFEEAWENRISYKESDRLFGEPMQNTTRNRIWGSQWFGVHVF